MAAEAPYIGINLPEGPFAYSMGFAVSRDSWLDVAASPPAILREKAKTLRQYPHDTVVFLPQAAPPLQELLALLGLSHLPATEEGLRLLAGLWDPDLVLMQRGQKGQEPVMVAGSLCHSTSWSPIDKIGHTMSEIHGPTPTVNEQYGSHIVTFIDRMRPDKIYQRSGWGLAASAQRDMHPAHGGPQITAKTRVHDLHVWQEIQGLRLLPESNGVAFMIRVLTAPIALLLADTKARAALRQQLETMPPEIAEYKGITPVREKVLGEIKWVDYSVGRA